MNKQKVNKFKKHCRPREEFSMHVPNKTLVSRIDKECLPVSGR